MKLNKDISSRKRSDFVSSDSMYKYFHKTVQKTSTTISSSIIHLQLFFYSQIHITTHLIMTNQPRLRSIIRVSIRPRKPKSSIPRIRSRNIFRPQRQNLRLRSCASRLRSSIRIADISQLIANAVGDDVRV